MKTKREKLFGVPPCEVTRKVEEKFWVHKSPKKGQNSFRITKIMLDTLLKTGKQIGKTPYLIITIDDGDKYVIESKITKSTKSKET